MESDIDINNVTKDQCMTKSPALLKEQSPLIFVKGQHLNLVFLHKKMSKTHLMLILIIPVT